MVLRLNNRCRFGRRAPRFLDVHKTEWPRQTRNAFPFSPVICAPNNLRAFLSYTEAGVSIPEQLGKLLALLAKLEGTGLWFGDNKLHISNNPWKEPPEAVVEKGMPAVREYFVDLFAEGVAPVPRCMIKVILVGQEGAGKTR